MKHLTLFFAFGALLFLSCQTVSARGTYNNDKGCLLFYRTAAFTY